MNIVNHESEVQQLKEKYENENLIKDAEIIYNSINVYGYQYYTYALTDLSKLVGLYSRHTDLYYDQDERIKKQEEIFAELHADRIKNGAIFSYNEVDEIYAAVRAGRSASKKYGRQIGVMCQRRWYLPAMRVKAAIDAGKIGEPTFGTINMLGWRDEAYYESDPWRGTWKGEGRGVLVNQAPHQLDLLQWYMGEIDELYGQWSNLNHPYIEVEDTANAILKFKNGGVANIIVSNSQKPGIYGKVHVHGENGASVGVQTDGGAMFIAGMSAILEPPVNDLWSVPGEEQMLEKWVKEDSDFFNGLESQMNYFHERNIEDFLQAILEGRPPLITGEGGRVTVEIFTAIYRSTRDVKPVKWPLVPENGSDFDGRV